MITIADSGERKSTIDGFFSKTIRDYEAEQAENKKPELQEYKAKENIWKAKVAGTIDKIRQLTKEGKSTADQEYKLSELEKSKPSSVRVPRLLYSDTTSEELAHKLATGHPSGAVASSEAGLVFGGHAMSTDSLMRTLGLYNVLWDGGTIQIDRRTSNSFTLKNARLTVGLQIQEAALRDFLGRGGDLTRGIGFFARCLIAWPISTQGTRFFEKSPDHWPALAVFNRRMSEILKTPAPMNEAGGLSPTLLDLSPAAKDAWVDFYNAIEGRQGDGGELFEVRDIASKTADNAARLAALFHLFEVGATGEIGKEHLEGAARLAAWHLNEAHRFFTGLVVTDEQRQMVQLDSWLVDQCLSRCEQSVSTREVMQRGPSKLRNKTALEFAIAGLADLGRVRLIERKRKRLIEINPALLIEGGTHA